MNSFSFFGTLLCQIRWLTLRNKLAPFLFVSSLLILPSLHISALKYISAHYIFQSLLLQQKMFHYDIFPLFFSPPINKNFILLFACLKACCLYLPVPLIQLSLYLHINHLIYISFIYICMYHPYISPRSPYHVLYPNILVI